MSKTFSPEVKGPYSHLISIPLHPQVRHTPNWEVGKLKAFEQAQKVSDSCSESLWPQPLPAVLELGAQQQARNRAPRTRMSTRAWLGQDT